MLCTSMQTLMSVRMKRITVMKTQIAQTQKGVLPAPATLAILEMELTVQVSFTSSVACFVFSHFDLCIYSPIIHFNRYQRV